SSASRTGRWPPVSSMSPGTGTISPVSRGRPASRQAASAPSRMRTSATPAQQPPGPGGGQPAVVVVDDDGTPGGQAPAAGGVAQDVDRRQRVPPGETAGGGGEGVVGELGVQVDVHRPGQVAVAVVV